MPNWSYNKLEIVKRNNENGFERIKNIVQTKKNTQCKLFDSLIGKRKDYTDDNWYDHNVKYYGTKWDVSYDEIKLEAFDDTLHLEFLTAWWPPIHFIDKLCEIYEVDSTLVYSEPLVGFAGCYVVDECGSTDDARTLLEGLYVYDKEQFWDEVNFQVTDCCTEERGINLMLNSFRSYVSDDDMKKIEDSIKRNKIF